MNTTARAVCFLSVLMATPALAGPPKIPVAEAWMTPLVLDTAEPGRLEVSVRALPGHSIEATQKGAAVRLRKLPKGCKLGSVKGATLGWRLAADAGAAVVHLPVSSRATCVGGASGTVALSVCEGGRGSAWACKKTKVTFEGVIRIGEPAPPSEYPAPARIVAMGDLHGDLGALRRALALGGLIDKEDHWTGGDTWVVQTGDQMDRGDDEREILEFLERLRLDAEAAGGRVVVLNGNHEAMQALGDLRYVTDGGFDDFPEPPSEAAAPADAAPDTVARTRAFAPGGAWARLLSTRNLAVKIGDTVFVHGGVTPQWAAMGLEAFNAPARAWLAGKGQVPDAVTDPQGPLWSRDYSDAPDGTDCATLDDALEALGATRMVVGHTVQEGGISPACDDRVWRIDVGMAAHYGGEPAALEIVGDKVRILK